MVVAVKEVAKTAAVPPNCRAKFSPVYAANSVYILNYRCQEYYPTFTSLFIMHALFRINAAGKWKVFLELPQQLYAKVCNVVLYRSTYILPTYV